MASYLQYRPATIGNLSAIPPSNNWQAICNTAEQQLATYLQYRRATIGKLSAIPPSNNWQAICNTAQHLTTYPQSRNYSWPGFQIRDILVRIFGSIPHSNGSGCGSTPKIFSFRIN
jgi:hypothetical protein